MPSVAGRRTRRVCSFLWGALGICSMVLLCRTAGALIQMCHPGHRPINPTNMVVRWKLPLAGVCLAHTSGRARQAGPGVGGGQTCGSQLLCQDNRACRQLGIAMERFPLR